MEKYVPSSIRLYQGIMESHDIFEDIDAGFTHFFQTGVDAPLQNFKNYSFSMSLSPRIYYMCPVVEFINYYLTKFHKTHLSSMALTALHEAISNTLLWGLLKLERSDSWLDFGHMVEKKLHNMEQTSDTFSIALKVKDSSQKNQLSVHIMNPHDDENLDISKFIQSSPRFPRGMDLINLFSDFSYDPKTKSLHLTFKDEENKNAFESFAQF